MARFLSALLVLALAACGTGNFDAQVTRFNALPAVERGRSFTILPDERQRGGLEFQAYAEAVAAGLERIGYVPLPASAGPADYAVLLDYGIGDRNTQIWRTPRSTVFGGVGGGSGGHFGTGIGIGVPLGDPYEYSSWTTYPHWLEVRLLNGPAFRRGERTEVFQGRAIAGLTRPNLPDAVPYLARAIFQNFPGRSGETVRVDIPVE